MSEKKKAKSIKDKLTLPENYIQDKGKMAVDTLNRMTNSKTLHSALVKLISKQSSVAKELYEIGSQVSELVKKIGSLHPGDLGAVLSDMASYGQEIDKAVLNWSDALQKEFVVPVTKSIEPHMKEVGDKTKDVVKQHSNLIKQMSKNEKEVQKAGKLGQVQLVDAMTEFNKKKDEIDKKKADILLDVLLMERERYIFIIEHYIKTLQAEIQLGKRMDSLSTDIQRWRDICYTKNALSEEQITALATASEQTFKQLSATANANNDEGVVLLYKTTSIGLHNLDEKPKDEDSKKPVSSNYVTRATLQSRQNRKSSSTSSTLNAIISPRQESPDFSKPPPGFPPEPEKVPPKFEGDNKDLYKEWMRKKLNYDTWMNSLVAYRLRESEGNWVACEKIVHQLNEQFGIKSTLPFTQSLPNGEIPFLEDSLPSPKGKGTTLYISSPLPGSRIQSMTLPPLDLPPAPMSATLPTSFSPPTSPPPPSSATLPPSLSSSATLPPSLSSSATLPPPSSPPPPSGAPPPPSSPRTAPPPPSSAPPPPITPRTSPPSTPFSPPPPYSQPPPDQQDDDW